ncbi:uncharacterized protein (DUF1800 family) [Prosthecobacter fusiformis]|uniref:Uncharacterized protein (DUF1800 family) n=1 Tax=Prosthecobacter fusiformis TaxID=48464 RepID=A0A4R7SQ22_9BACT|nr:DUF1800 family protein [Prosthecobacter fusiformis]TDU80725.1 uncharacterized protein (DUF1800 family) [Prosthecobacter fusiformis]
MANQPPRYQPGLRVFCTWVRNVALAVTLASGAAHAAPANFESRVITTPVQSTGDQWNAVTFTRTFATPPVVIMGPATQTNSEQCLMRVRNVTTTGFEYQIDEWDFKNGYHPAETVHFFALTEGTHVFGTQRWQVGRASAVNRTPVSISLSGFTAAPVVLGQVETTVNSAGVTGKGTKALKTRISSVTTSGFQVKLETQELDTAAISNEGISYVAVSTGTGYLDGKILSAVRTTGGITSTLATVTFPAAHTAPVLIAQTQSATEADAGEVKMASLSTTSVQLRIQEETSLDAETTHVAEDLGYIVLGDMNGELAAKVEVGDVIVTQASATTWTTVTLASSYTNPVVVMGPLSYRSSTSMTVRVRDVTATSFQFQVDRWDHHSTQSHNTAEKLSYVVMESGSYAIGGTRWEAGVKTGVTQAGTTQALATGFPNTPAVFSQVATTADPQAVQSRVSGISSTGFTVELDESEIDATPHAAETVHWIAMTQGTSNFFSTRMRFQAGQGTNIDSSFRTRTFSRVHADPYLFASMQTKADQDPATLRWRYLFADRVDLVAQEDAHPAQYGEGTVNNTHTAETVAFLVVQGAEDLDEDGAPDAWESTVGLSATNGADGGLDTDSDLLTNQQEFHNRLDFVTSSDPSGFTGGVITVSTVTTSGYEVNDTSVSPTSRTNARLRLNRNGGFAPMTINFTLAGTATTDTTRAPASSADYTAWTGATSGTQVTTSIPIAANAQSVDIYIRPVDDGLNEYPEGLRMTAALNGSLYTIGSTTNSVVIINDSMDIPANQKLFLGTFLAQGSAVTTASGFATVILNGPNNKAKISTVFNGLTTPQADIDGSHVHYNGGTIVYGDPDGLPNGPLSEYPWTITDSGGYKAQKIIDALFRKSAGELLYVNVHTTRYSSGEIKAELQRVVGTGPFIEPAAPGTLENFTTDEQVRRDCARFLTQATFGASQADVDALYTSIGGDKKLATNRIAAYTTWITNQWALPQTTLYDYHLAANTEEFALRGLQANLPAVVDNPLTTVDETYPAAPPPDNALDWTRWGSVPPAGTPPANWTYRPIPPGLNKESYDPDQFNRRRAWWTVVNRAQDQLRQRTAFALDQIYIVSDRLGTVQTRTYGHSRYYDMLADFADSVRNQQPPNTTYSTATGAPITIRHLLKDVSKHPIMGKYLSHLKNQKATYDGSGNQILSPDENFAREIMQLFSIGLLQLHPDGTIMLGSNGQPIPTYDNDDIKDLSKIFTGWSFAYTTGSAANGYLPTGAQNNFLSGSEGAEYFHPGYENPMKNFPAYHDEGEKVILGSTLPAYGGSSTDNTARMNYAEADLDAAIGLLFDHDNIAPFLSKQLIQRLVTSNPSRGYVYRVANVFKNNGSGVRGSLKDVIQAILLDYEARTLTNVDPQVVNSTTSVNVGFGKVKEPIIRYIQVLRAFNSRSQISMAGLNTNYGYPLTQLNSLGSGATSYRYSDTNADLGQTPNNMPSVFNWYLPDYTPGGRVAAAGLVAPELQIMTENLVVRTTNYHRTIDYSSIVDPTAALPAGQSTGTLLGDTGALLDNVFIDLGPITTAYRAAREAAGATDISATTILVDQLDALLCAGSLKAKYPYVAGGKDPRSIIIDQTAATFVDAPPVSQGNAGNRVRTALYLITNAPEFVVQK